MRCIMHSKWLDMLSDFDTSTQDKIIADMVRYGLNMKLKHSEDPYVSAMVNLMSVQIDRCKGK